MQNLTTVSPLKRLRNKYTKPPIKLYYWRYDYPRWLNFGDEITPYILERLFGRKSTWAPPPECDMAGAGSLIEILQRESNGHDIAVWGSGFIKSGDKNSLSNLHFSAVRGKLSQDRVGDKNTVLGDPGLLLPLVFNPKRSKRYKIGVIPNYIDQHLPELDVMRGRQDAIIINALDPIEKVISEAASCELILASSLHGLIVSDAYQIPNHWLHLSGKVTGGGYKFKDYYSIFDEELEPLEPGQLQSLDTDNLINQYKPKQNLDHVQNGLVQAFPF